MIIDTKHFHFNFKRLLSDKEIVILFSLCVGYFLLAEFGIIKFSAEFFSKFRPDHWLHFLFGYAVNKFWRLTYKTSGLFRNVVIDFYLSVLVHIGKEIFDVIRRQTLLAFDLTDILAALLGLLAEDLKYALRNEVKIRLK